MLRSCFTCFFVISILIAIIIVGPLGLYAYGQYTTITCVREGGQVDCVKQVTWLDLFPIPPDETLPHITGARVQNDCHSRDGGAQVECYSNELVIENAERSFTIGSPYFNEDTAAETKARVNDYLRQPGLTAPLVIPCRNVPYTIFTLGLIVFLYGGLGFAFWLIFSKRPVIFFGRHIGGPSVAAYRLMLQAQRTKRPLVTKSKRQEARDKKQKTGRVN